MIKWILTKIVGTKNQREVRRLRPIVEQIVSIEESWNGKGQEFLLEKTREWQGYLHRFLPMDLPPVRIVEAAPREELEEIAAKLNARFESLKSEFASLPAVEATPASIEEGKAAWNNITPQFDKLRERYLNQILPEAFAAVKHNPGTIHRSSAWGESRPRQAQDVRPAVRVEPFALAAWVLVPGDFGQFFDRQKFGIRHRRRNILQAGEDFTW